MTDLLDVESVPAYVASVPSLAARLGTITEVQEVGDGNLNLVFIVRDADGVGLVLKQSLPYVRTDPSWPMTRERSSREAYVLAAHQAIDPAHVPGLLFYDASQYVLALEDLSDHQVWRTVLNSRTSSSPDDALAAAALGEYIASVGFGTSVLGVGSAAHKQAVATAINPELCEITEDLVLTEPFVSHEHNVVHPSNEADVAELAGDPDVRHAAGLAKLAFMTRAESLLHGDLHTGSVFVRFGAEPSVRAFDSEFGFYGPLGFDLGMLWGNYVLAAARAVAQGQADRAASLLDLGRVTWDSFEATYRRRWPSRQDPRVYEEVVLSSILSQVWRDAVTYAGAEVARRVIGFAKVADIETLPEAQRVEAARRALRAARTLITHTLHGGTGPNPGVLGDVAAAPLGL
ncbi:S-methyl-5-thioribose kinase [Cryptosporangium aurantiacum]|uniref:S-methyl-5-thioribose kinase n=1 Tax=Cryptosporangium aurantiacum TaxID=134849 RepID=A0A1M7MDA5_9ACTN|nr:S-methyl-5-thioribose kinase [Cryptosporangium aurantiacum]SHM88758.1 5'-methylthioribose kinase [Cryptosporangium aurantiacum]